MDKASFGMIGLGVMGRNFLLNVADSGFVCSGYDISQEKVDALNEEGKEHDVTGFSDIKEFVGSLATPRSVMLLVPAGEIVDKVIDELTEVLEEGDLIIDGGNSHYPDTIRREKSLNEKGFEFLGVGVSGGAKGARLGPSIMIGGKNDVYQRVAPILEGVSAKVGDEPCAAHLGNGAAGHYVKMVHNGIEYAMMQLICETYDVMKRVCGLDNRTMSETFEKWNGGGLRSYLIEITYKILRFKDGDSGQYLVESILDTAGQKGTGRWTSESALELGIPIPTIDAAVTMRQLSAQKELRTELDKKTGLSDLLKSSGVETNARFDAETFESMLFGAFIISYAQGIFASQRGLSKNTDSNSILLRLRRSGVEAVSFAQICLSSFERFLKAMNRSRLCSWMKTLRRR